MHWNRLLSLLYLELLGEELVSLAALMLFPAEFASSLAYVLVLVSSSSC